MGEYFEKSKRGFFFLNENAKKISWTINIPVKIDAGTIEDILVDAFEASDMHYWASLDNSTPVWDNKPKDMPSSQYALSILLDGGEIKFCDVEGTEDDSDWILTITKLISGIQQNATERPHDCDLENTDGCTVDCIMQYALFGKLVFG